MPCRLLRTTICGSSRCKPTCTSYSVAPVACRARSATGARKASLRSPSAVARPRARMSSAGAPLPTCSPPASDTLPPSDWACTLCRVKPFSLKCTMPRASCSSGTSGRRRSRLPCRPTVPVTRACSNCSIGRCSASFSVAGPAAAARSSACSVIPANGERATTSSQAGSAALPWPETSSTGVDRSGIAAWMASSGTLLCSPNQPWALRTCMPARSNTSSPASWVISGQGASPSARRRGGT